MHFTQYEAIQRDLQTYIHTFVFSDIHTDDGISRLTQRYVYVTKLRQTTIRFHYIAQMAHT